ncbi:hypothetical protein AXW67_17635 [Bradyrhizobium neotropicale]|uniref:Uncharacterized protein n=1 Tax=Bradyrhizobium neotropicale TaxID=1497615 RepID=A0A176Z4E9_9BRAD|nr:hypothetical protein AXW67_17635 [Bradyrhizobium neotropicale]
MLSISPPDDYPFARTVTIGSDASVSLGTDDKNIAEARQANALDHLHRLFDLTEAAPISLSHKDMVALSEETYRLYQEIHRDIPANLTHGCITRLSVARRLKVASRIHPQPR